MDIFSYSKLQREMIESALYVIQYSSQNPIEHVAWTLSTTNEMDIFPYSKLHIEMIGSATLSQRIIVKKKIKHP
jgi:hypothetical protein